MIPIAYNIRNLTVRKTTTAAAGLGLALVVFVFASVMMMGKGIERTLGRAANPSAAIGLRKGSSMELESSIDEAAVGVVGAAPGVAHFPNGRPQVLGEVVVVMTLHKPAGDGLGNVVVRGVPDDVFLFRPGAKIIAGRAAAPGTDEVVVGSAIRGRFQGLDVGGAFDIKKNRPARVVGVFSDDGSSFESEVWGDIESVRSTFGRQGVVSSIRIQLESPSKFELVREAVESNRQLNVGLMRETEFAEKASQGTSQFLQALGYMVAVFFSFGAMIGAMITMHATVAQRQREIGALRAIGFSRTTILVSFLLESMVLALGGGAVGAAASLLMGFVRIPTINMQTLSEIVFTFEPTVGIVTRAMVLAALMGLFGGLLPALRAARINPIEAMRGA